MRRWEWILSRGPVCFWRTSRPENWSLPGRFFMRCQRRMLFHGQL
uniref:Uncharacterized protein n=1 Tax=Rhizophora mucronata TaxID=61149 RepID=A0A2P2NPM4_RHIMU